MNDSVDSCLNHVAYHAETAITLLTDLARVTGNRPELTRVLISLHDIMLCAIDAQAVGRQIMDFARDEERLLGPAAATWRAAAKSLYEIALRGPCLRGDVEAVDSVLPARYSARVG